MDKASTTKPRDILQEPIEQTATPPDTDIFDMDSEVSIGNEYDFKPLEKSGFEGIQEKLFSVIRGRGATKSAPARQTPIVRNVRNEPQTPIHESQEWQPMKNVIPDYVRPVETGGFGPLRKKNFIEKARDQLKFPEIRYADVAIRGLALLVFISGAYLLYSAIPTKPDLVIGMVMISVAGNIIMSSR